MFPFPLQSYDFIFSLSARICMHYTSSHIIYTFGWRQRKNSGNAQKLKYILMPYKMRYAGWVERREKKCCLTDVDYQVCWHIECVLLRRGFFMQLSELGLNLNISKGLHNKFHSFLRLHIQPSPLEKWKIITPKVNFHTLVAWKIIRGPLGIHEEAKQHIYTFYFPRESHDLSFICYVSSRRRPNSGGESSLFYYYATNEVT